MPTPQENHDLTGCFACGDTNSHGLHLMLAPDPSGQAVVGAWRTPAWAVSWRGIIHGGILSAVMDEAMGWAVALFYQRTGLTTRLAVRLRQAVGPGQMLQVRAWVVRCHRRAAETAAELTTAAGGLVASAEAMLYLSDILPVPERP